MPEFRFKKKYGQNFLNNRSAIEKIVSSINPTENDLIIEIGPGGGVITEQLKKYKANILAFEIDEETKKFLSKLEDDKTKIIYSDFLKIDLPSFLSTYKYEKLYIIGNLPYYITTPIIEHLINSKVEIESLTIMVQKEVAERFLAKPKTKQYGYMTVLINYNFDIEKIIEVKNTDFTPIPKVDSTVLKLIKKEKEPLDYDNFKKLLKDAFQFKRKTLNNNLKSYDKEMINEILKERGHSLSNRAEEIDLETFIDLARNL